MQCGVRGKERSQGALLSLWPESQDGGAMYENGKGWCRGRGWALILVILRPRDFQCSSEDSVGCRSLNTLLQCHFFLHTLFGDLLFAKI